PPLRVHAQQLPFRLIKVHLAQIFQQRQPFIRVQICHMTTYSVSQSCKQKLCDIASSIAGLEIGLNVERDARWTAVILVIFVTLQPVVDSHQLSCAIIAPHCCGIPTTAYCQTIKRGRKPLPTILTVAPTLPSTDLDRTSQFYEQK